MFNSIRGRLTERFSESIRVETSGLEWDISVPAIDAARFPSPGAEVRVLTWMYHREDQVRLYGFADERRRDTFLELMKVEGIGPKAALKIMGGIGQEDLERALEAADIARLEAVPGLGKKTAQKMVLALKGRLARLDEEPAGRGPHAELVEALAGMGYDKKAAADALAKAEKELSASGSMPADAKDAEKVLFKRAIVLLTTG